MVQPDQSVPAQQLTLRQRHQQLPRSDAAVTLLDRADVPVQHVDHTQPVDQLASAATPADPVSDTSGLPNRTRFLPRLRVRILATEKVPFP